MTAESEAFRLYYVFLKEEHLNWVGTSLIDRIFDLCRNIVEQNINGSVETLLLDCGLFCVSISTRGSLWRPTPATPGGRKDFLLH